MEGGHHHGVSQGHMLVHGNRPRHRSHRARRYGCCHHAGHALLLGVLPLWCWLDPRLLLLVLLLLLVVVLVLLLRLVLLLLLRVVRRHCCKLPGGTRGMTWQRHWVDDVGVRVSQNVGIVGQVIVGDGLQPSKGTNEIL